MNPIWYVLIGFILGQSAAVLASYLGALLKGDANELH